MRTFIKQSLLGGLLVVAPLTVLFLIFRWLFRMISDFIAPLSTKVSAFTPAPPWLIDIVVVFGLLVACALLGSLFSTGLGRIVHSRFDSWVSGLPGYKLVRDVFRQLLGANGSPFSNGTTALVKIFGDQADAWMIGIVTCRHEDGTFTCFCCTSPNPTSAFLVRMAPELVQLRPDISLDQAFRVIMSGGAGADELFDAPPRAPDSQYSP